MVRKLNMGEWVTLLNGRIEIIIEKNLDTGRFMTQISDHALKHTCILDDTHETIKEALNASLQLLKLDYSDIGARRQLGGNRSSKPFPSVSKAECVGSIPTAPANNSVMDTLQK